jgi:protein-S-isoprenylcysteine O-methyltransferase Ste14
VRWSTLVAFGLIAVFLGMERLARRGPEARSLRAGPFDRRSTALLGVAFLIGILTLFGAELLNAVRVGRLSRDSIGWVGVGLMAGAIGLRYWAARVLGRFYTRTLRVADDQVVVDHGPYRMIRHPGYGADVLMWIGAGLATVNWMATTALTLVMLGSYGYRIRCEEDMLLATLGPRYQGYRERTWKLVPFIY